ncbi:hypothetical protein DUNSADRAFT_1482 [Dunaliella salina]|uniref:Uncharacterized protein n=1 Tax=Dunaliella salina TaxID=3046 RepID=A0ABQ7FXE2_DUNSA|nr:hypothetical protein DUNSADRAFT_1482 [Dunaliella salina]|eukprot:KAF5827029.1 hypothetical protein DUNSADRAFT_1482 [Dunaliella salina]
MRGGPGLQRNQAASSLTLPDLPSTVLSAIHAALLVQGSDGFCEQHKDAAAFRSTCKILHDSAVLPCTLKLSIPVSRTSLLPGLAAVLSRSAASTNLHLRLTEPRVDPAAEEDEAASRGVTKVVLQMWKHQEAEARRERILEETEVEEASWFEAVPNLKVLGDRLCSLEIPCHQSVSDLLCAICCDLPHLQHAVLHLCDDAFAKPDLDDEVPTGPPWNPGWVPRVRRDVARMRKSQLCSVTLCASHNGTQPFQLSQGDLNLSEFYALQHFVLRGPIVKVDACDGVNPLVLRPHVQVTIDPGLCGRRPTPWARELTFVYKSFDTMPGSAIPNESEYEEEDAEAREERKRLFVKEVTAEALKLNRHRAWKHLDIMRDFISRALDDAAVEGYMDEEACERRSDVLLRDCDTDSLAQKIVDEYNDFACGNF